MNDDDTFRLVLIIYCVVFTSVGLYHRIRSYTGEKIDRWQEGIFILFGLRLTALAMFAGGVTWMFQPQWMAWSSMPTPVWLRWFGIVLAGFGGVQFSLAVHSLGKNLTDTVVTRKDHSLVTTEPYSFVRHPFYVASAFGAVGVCLAMANWLLLVAFVVGFCFLIARTRIEEEKLIERFGDDYREYMLRVGRFVPRPKS